jgi:predicted RNase H-like HicB family nuclease
VEYIAYMYKDPRSDYGVAFPDFPGCVTAAKNPAQAIRRAQEVLEFHIDGMVKDGDKIPKPSTVNDIVNDPERKDAIMVFLVRADAEPPKRINISLKQRIIDDIDRCAEQIGLTRSAYIARVAAPAKAGRVYAKARAEAHRKSIRSVTRKRK